MFCIQSFIKNNKKDETVLLQLYTFPAKAFKKNRNSSENNKNNKNNLFFANNLLTNKFIYEYLFLNVYSMYLTYNDFQFQYQC